MRGFKGCCQIDDAAKLALAHRGNEHLRELPWGGEIERERLRPFLVARVPFQIARLAKIIDEDVDVAEPLENLRLHATKCFTLIQVVDDNHRRQAAVFFDLLRELQQQRLPTCDDDGLRALVRKHLRGGEPDASTRAGNQRDPAFQFKIHMSRVSDSDIRCLRNAQDAANTRRGVRVPLPVAPPRRNLPAQTFYVSCDPLCGDEHEAAVPSA